jgi:hypothetical protein
MSVCHITPGMGNATSKIVIAQHNIQNPQEFWSSAQQLTALLPADLKLISVFPSREMKMGTPIKINQL